MKKTTKETKKKETPRGKNLSDEGRANIIAGQKKRWAAYRKAKKRKKDK